MDRTVVIDRTVDQITKHLTSEHISHPVHSITHINLIIRNVTDG